MQRYAEIYKGIQAGLGMLVNLSHETEDFEPYRDALLSVNTFHMYRFTLQQYLHTHVYEHVYMYTYVHV